MMYRVFTAAMAGSLIFAGEVTAATLPAIQTSADNQVPACATPGRLMAYATSRNGRIDAKFDGTATEYMRHGESLKIRWDYAFFQMLVETANLSFVGDVKPAQNNFAGLGATGGGEPGERFKTLGDGVKAHLQHVLMYTGQHIDDPVADRTRKVQEWGVLTKWQRTIKGPMTFAQLTRQWSPKDRGYARDIAAVADSFYSRFCNAPDPKPELVAEARGQGVTIDTAAAVKPAADAPTKGKATAVRAIADARKTSGPGRFGLGAGSFGATMPEPSASTSAGSSPPTSFTVLNGADNATDARDKSAANDAATKSEMTVASATAAAAAAVATTPAPAASAAEAKSSCRVWQASYGGQKAVIIKAIDKGQTNYTVLDVNEGREQREVAAYIAAYAKEGSSLGEFQTSGKALTKAFELCPES